MTDERPAPPMPTPAPGMRQIHQDEPLRPGVEYLPRDEAAPDWAHGPRRVSIDVPDGYMLSVTLTPWTPEP